MNTGFLKRLACALPLLLSAHAGAQPGLPDQLSQAIQKADVAAVRALLDAGAAPTARDSEGFAPLVLTVLAGAHTKNTADALGIAGALLDAGADIEQEGPAGNAPLATACSQTRSPDMAAFLIARGADVNARGYNGSFPLYQAVRKNHVATAELLIRHGANVKAKNRQGETALHYAALNDMDGVATLLIARGADINARDLEGKTPLAWALGRTPASFVDAPPPVPRMAELLKRLGAAE